MSDIKLTQVDAAQCPKCKDWLFSRARHDFRGCKCGTLRIDGGLEYERLIGYIKFKDLKTRSVLVSETKQEIYDDWNKRDDVLQTLSDLTVVEEL